MNTLMILIGTGLGATLLVDVWALLRRRLFGIALPDYGLVGRWIAYLPRGRFHHEAIAASAALPGERIVGWISHYLIGIGFATLLQLVNPGWFRQPSIGPALLLGICTVAAPFLLMQPGMGAGIAASRTARPGTARLHSLLTHAVFGLGLYLAATALVSLQSNP